MKSKHAHPNEPGVWTLLEHDDNAAIWRRDRSDPVPVSMYYILCPPRQAEVVYSEERAREAFARFAADLAPSGATHPD